MCLVASLCRRLASRCRIVVSKSRPCATYASQSIITLLMPSYSRVATVCTSVCLSVLNDLLTRERKAVNVRPAFPFSGTSPDMQTLVFLSLRGPFALNPAGDFRPQILWFVPLSEFLATPLTPSSNCLRLSWNCA